MFKATVLIAATFALSAQAAIASPVGGSLTASATSEKAAKSERSLVSSAIRQVKFSLSTFRGTVGGSAGKSTDYKSTPAQQCDEAKRAADEEEDAGETKKVEPAGPEPIYFGF